MYLVRIKRVENKAMGRKKKKTKGWFEKAIFFLK